MKNRLVPDKFIMTKSSGKPIPEGARFLVLRLDSDTQEGKLAREAARHYALTLQHVPGLEQFGRELTQYVADSIPGGICPIRKDNR